MHQRSVMPSGRNQDALLQNISLIESGLGFIVVDVRHAPKTLLSTTGDLTVWNETDQLPHASSFFSLNCDPAVISKLTHPLPPEYSNTYGVKSWFVIVIGLL